MAVFNGINFYLSYNFYHDADIQSGGEIDKIAKAVDRAMHQASRSKMRKICGQSRGHALV